VASLPPSPTYPPEDVSVVPDYAYLLEASQDPNYLSTKTVW
jgi:hypothetical protein